MHRRQALALVAGLSSLAGCSSRDREPTPETPTPTPRTPTPTPGTPTPTPDRGRISDGIRFESSVTDGFGADSPARVELRLTNRLDAEITATGTFSPIVPFESRFGHHVERDTQLLLNPDHADDYWFQIVENQLVPTAAVLPDAPENGCWRIPPEYDGIATPPGPMSREIDADTTITHQYTLYYLAECVPGTYQFTQALSLDVDAFDAEELVPLRLRLAAHEDGDVEIHFFGIPESNPVVSDA